MCAEGLCLLECLTTCVFSRRKGLGLVCMEDSMEYVRLRVFESKLELITEIKNRMRS